MICKNCGNPLKEENSFCTKCGAKREFDSNNQMVTPPAPTYNNQQSPVFTPSAPIYNNPTAPVYNNPTAPAYNNPAPKQSNKKLFIIIGCIIAVIAIIVAIIVGISVASDKKELKEAAEKRVIKAAAGSEEADLRSCYSSVCAAYTQLSVEGPFDKADLMSLTLNLMGGESKMPAGFDIEFNNAGVLSVSMTCEDGGTLKYDGTNFSGGGENHEHNHSVNGNDDSDNDNDDSDSSVDIPAPGYINKPDSAMEEADTRAFYSSACAAFTIVVTSGQPVEEDALYQETFTLLGNSSIDRSGWTIEFSEYGITAVSIPCEDGGMLRYDGAGFSGGGANHNHGQ